MIVEIRPIESKKWHGKSGNENFTQTKVVEALIDGETNTLVTGLSVEEEIEYGKKLNGVDLSSKAILDGKPHPFYGTKQGRLVLPNRTIFLNTESPLDYLKIKLAKASKFVANSIKELEAGEYPEATHVIYDEAEEINRKAGKIQLKNKAIKKSLSMSLDEKISIIQILRNKNLKGQSQDFVDVVIDEIIETEAENFLKYEKMDKAEIYIRAVVLEAISKNILTKEGSSIHYMGDTLGFDYEETVKYFLDPQNQKMKVAILEKINNI